MCEAGGGEGGWCQRLPVSWRCIYWLFILVVLVSRVSDIDAPWKSSQCLSEEWCPRESRAFPIRDLKASKPVNPRRRGDPRCWMESEGTQNLFRAPPVLLPHLQPPKQTSVGKPKPRTAEDS
ncbi:hypothetical protein VUR80DRAFT_8612 [Thermomyces stellatus]